MLTFESKIYKLEDNFFNNTFNIPIYQRLYVWREIQVSTLIDDLLKAYNNSKDKIYYLGGIVVVEKNNKFDLIDGQQRFTTLKILINILGDDSLKLDFSIREYVWKDYKDLEQSDNADIQRMIVAKNILSNKLEECNNISNFDKKDFLKYLIEKVSLVVTKVPEHTDLNKLFELINGRGEQLQQHEILKAKILSKISDKNKKKFGMIWDICANMDEYIDINIKNSLMKEDKKISWGDYFNKYQQLDFYNLLLNFKFKTIENKSDNSIFEIIKGDYKKPRQSIENKVDDSSHQYFSIISFPLFLLYTLVSFYKNDFLKKMEGKKIEFKDSNLIKLFEATFLDELEKLDKKSADIKSEEFIKNLFDFRTLFDKWIIKNKKDIGDLSNYTAHKISKVNKIISNNKTSKTINTVSDSSDLALLQSMLYHSHTRNTQEWIIPFLSCIKDNIKDNLTLLKKIDNYLYSQIDNNGTILDRSINVNQDMDPIDYYPSISKYLTCKPESYHHFTHYWFYKMDWIIYCTWKEKPDNFKFTARNSIEHISPQTKDKNNRIDNIVTETYGNSFGNLALISISQNSSFSNKGFIEKMGKFKEEKIPNLKMSLIYDNEIWGDTNCKEHLDNCLELVEKYYK